MIKANVTGSTQRAIVKQCLNRNFDEVLQKLRLMPLQECSVSFLQIYLARAVQEGHVASVDYVWNRFVQRAGVLVVRPDVLCDLGNLMFFSGSFGILDSVWRHYNKFYRSEQGAEWDDYRYHLLRLRIEGYATRSTSGTAFPKKWRKLLEDLDRSLPAYPFSVWDFPQLKQSLGGLEERNLARWVIKALRGVQNEHTSTLLLNMTLQQPHLDRDAKLRLFRWFVGRRHCSADALNETIHLLARRLQKDEYTELRAFLSQMGIDAPEEHKGS
ncbi:AGR142Cp [Eremothecium gossypii ATCC 10895]|uniref:AGR142Cp n=2 Tax=Eremothecium gossypii TaxID=33169 RepID=Q74ZQ6_EREGS|nr:AGR142Cp [Eremothecium gossypii ATCC 10895]AAS54632.1 AGR142Cp [Eremothecium gossypii ATCC 10895]AEY98962.1 FAGR142Cp [Eremothecium gossypii FDAG1]